VRFALVHEPTVLKTAINRIAEFLWNIDTKSSSSFYKYYTETLPNYVSAWFKLVSCYQIQKLGDILTFCLILNIYKT
jgi:hypothetical protein